MDRRPPPRGRPEQSLGAELRSSLLLLGILLGPIIGLVVLVHEHDRQVSAHRRAAHAAEAPRPAPAAPPQRMTSSRSVPVPGW